jgi:hypothetical protein
MLDFVNRWQLWRLRRRTLRLAQTYERQGIRWPHVKAMAETRDERDRLLGISGRGKAVSVVDPPIRF